MWYICESSKKSVEVIEKKIQEAKDIIQAHGKRMQELIRSDPVNNKVDENWKMIISSKEMLKQKQKTIKNSSESQKSTIKPQNKPPNRIIEIRNVQANGSSGVLISCSHKNNRTQHDIKGGFQFPYSFSDFKNYFR